MNKAVKRQQEMNELCRRNTAQAQMRQRKKYDEKSLQTKPYAAAEAIKKVKQDLATKEIEQRLKQEIEKQRLNETLCKTRPMSEAGENAMNSDNCNTVKMVTGKLFGKTKIGSRTMSIITVGGHEVT